MRVLYLGKRRYTNRDALAERFGRIYRLPMHWQRGGHDVCLQLLDYRGWRRAESRSDGFPVKSWPMVSPISLPALARECRSFAPEVVIAAGDSLVGLLGYRLARGSGCRYVLDAYDDYQTFGSSRLFLGWNAFAWLRARSDAVFYASRGLADSHPGPGPAWLVPNAIDPEEFRNRDRAAARRELGLDAGPTWIGYFGSMEPDRGVGVLLEAIRILRRQGRDTRLLLAGARHPGTALPSDHEGSVHYLGQQPHARIPVLMAACDVLALPYLRSPMMDMGASCKIAEYLFCQRPIAASRTPNFETNFAEQAALLSKRLAEPGDPLDLARVIGLQIDDPILVPSPGYMTWSAVADEAARRLLSLKQAASPGSQGY